MSPKEKTPKPPIDAEDLIDEALEETFPASDPISPGVGPGEPMAHPAEKRKKPKPNKTA
jgi:hypothetical protein